ncbi:MAG: hypothetical protein ACFB6R_12045 [Alphaproteobacteria bacterium]
MVKAAVLTVHGQGRTLPGYANTFIRRIKGRLPPRDWQHVHFEQAYYQRSLDRNQTTYYEAVRKKIQSHTLRQAFLFGFSDAASLQTNKRGTEAPYYLAQFELRAALRKCYRELTREGPLGPDARVIVVANSLGAQVMSNYFWDANQLRARGQNPKYGIWKDDEEPFTDDPVEDAFCRGAHVHTFYTTGCSIPIFVAGQDPDSIFAFDRLNDAFRWINIFDDDDALGWPLRPLSPSYAALVEDRELRLGHTILTHMSYWSHRKVVGEVARTVGTLIKS